METMSPYNSELDASEVIGEPVFQEGQRVVVYKKENGESVYGIIEEVKYGTEVGFRYRVKVREDVLYTKDESELVALNIQESKEAK